MSYTSSMTGQLAQQVDAEINRLLRASWQPDRDDADQLDIMKKLEWLGRLFIDAGNQASKGDPLSIPARLAYDRARQIKRGWRARFDAYKEQGGPGTFQSLTIDIDEDEDPPDLPAKRETQRDAT